MGWMTSNLVTVARKSGKGDKLWLELLKCCGVFLIVELIVGFICGVLLIVFGLVESDAAWNFASLLGLIFGIFGIILCGKLEKMPVVSMGFVRKEALSSYLKGLLIGFLMFSAVVFSGTALGAFEFIGFTKNFQPAILALWFGGFLIQGMFEEVMCRGYFMISIARKSSILTAVIANSFLFAIMHYGNDGFNILPFVNLMLFGLFTSLTMLATNNIWCVGAIHSIWNFVQGCFFGLSVSGMPLMETVFVFKSTNKSILNGGDFGPEGGLLVTFILVIATATAGYRYWKKCKKGETNGD